MCGHTYAVTIRRVGTPVHSGRRVVIGWCGQVVPFSCFPPQCREDRVSAGRAVCGWAEQTTCRTDCVVEPGRSAVVEKTVELRDEAKGDGNQPRR